MSFAYEDPKEMVYMRSANCTGAASAVDLSATLNHCLPLY
jgi:hypothetical protein